MFWTLEFSENFWNLIFLSGLFFLSCFSNIFKLWFSEISFFSEIFYFGIVWLFLKNLVFGSTLFIFSCFLGHPIYERTYQIINESLFLLPFTRCHDSSFPVHHQFARELSFPLDYCVSGKPQSSNAWIDNVH